MKKIEICGITCLAIFAALFLFAIIGLESIVDGFIQDAVKLAPETQEYWANNPGATNSLVSRNFIWYNFTNPRGFLYRQEKPRFHQIPGYLYQQKFNFTNITYSQDMSRIDFNYWLFFDVLNGSRNVNDTVTILNLAPLSFWSVLDTADISLLAIQGFGSLYVQANLTLKSQAIGQGVQALYLSNQTSFQSLCSKKHINNQLCQMLWNDPIFGFSDANNYQVWVDWSFFNDQSSGQALYKYFGLTRQQLTALDKDFEAWCSSVNQVLNNWYCDGQQCKSSDLAIRQFGNATITADPPVGDAVDSICMTGNITCEGYPELYSFYKYQFPYINNNTQFQGLVFWKQTLDQIFSPRNGTLLNVGNLSELFQVGFSYDKNHKKDDLKKLQQMLHTKGQKSAQKAIVIWQYTKYFANDFLMKTNKGGNTKKTAMAGIFAASLYQAFIQFSQWIIPQQISLLVAQMMPDCGDFLINKIGVTQQVVDSICKDITPFNYTNYYKILEPCDNQYILQAFQKNRTLTNLEIAALYDKEDISLCSLSNKAHSTIKNKYKCSFNKNANKCTQFELGLYQFINSSVTLNPISSIYKKYEPALSGHLWNAQLPQWQYRHFLNQVYLNPSEDATIYNNISRLIDLLSFDKLFSVGMVQNLTLQTNLTRFQKLFYLNNKTIIMQYIRFVAIEVGFGGLVQTRTVNELLFGYQDPFLKNLKEMDPMLGGDPSIQTLVALNQPNSTFEQAVNYPQSMYTGYSDPMITRNYILNKGKQYIVFNKTWYDGYNIRSQMQNPFKENVYLKGTDALQVKAKSSTSDKQYLYVDNLYRVGQVQYNNTQTRFGFQVYKHVISDQFLGSSQRYPHNDIYYQAFQGFLNLSFLGPPVYLSQNHMYKTDAKWIQMIDVYDQKGQNPQFPNYYDQTYLIFQPRSGGVFSACIFLQSNFYMSGPDQLFKNKPMMLPLMSVYRAANVTQETANDLFGDLKTAIALPKKMTFVSLVGILMSLIGLCLCRFFNKKRVIKQSLLASGDDINQTFNYNADKKEFNKQQPPKSQQIQQKLLFAEKDQPQQKNTQKKTITDQQL